MFLTTSLTIILATVVACLPLHINPGGNNTNTMNLIMGIRNALTGIGRQNILAAGGEKSFVFDFAKPPRNTIQKFSGGMTVQAKELTFPTLTGVLMTVGIVILDACSMQQPHTHPRGGEFVLVVEGSVRTQFKAEENTDMVTNELATWSSTFFPKGSIHASFNPYCTRAIFIEVFDSNDQGTTIAAPNFFFFDEQLVRAALGGEVVLSLKELATIRANEKGFLVSDPDCLARCGIKDANTTAGEG